MSHLSYIEKLLDGVEVEWKSFGEIAKIQRGASPRPIAKFITDDEDGVPWIKIGDTESGSKYVEQTAQKITKEGATKSRVLKKGDFIISNSMSFGRPYILNITGAIHDGWASISEFGDKLNSDFLYHYLSSQSVQNYWISKINSGSVSNLNADIIKTLPVPIPCPNNPEKSLAIQAEIVRILDAFTAMTAELNMRKKQYNYYRDQLFARSGSKSEKLGEISKIYLGLTYTPKYVEKGVKFISAKNTSKDFLDLTDTKYISEEEYLSSTSNAKPKRGDVLFTRVGSNLGHPVIVETDEPLCMFVSLGYIRVNPAKVLNSYIKHWMNTALFWDQVEKHTYGAAKVNLNTGWLNKFDVLLPSLEEQARIVEILDKFEVLTTSLQEGLPREIELRQKQYEYYRDLLLSFPKSHSGEAA